MNRRTLAGLFAGLLANAVRSDAVDAQITPRWRSVDVARQLRDSSPHRVRLKYSVGKVDVRPGTDRLLYAMHLRYDEARTVPLDRYDAPQRSALLGVESLQSSRLPAGRDDEAGELRLALPRSVPLDLDFEFGGTKATLDLGDMSLQSVHLDCGAADARVLFSKPNRGRMRELEVNVGAADFVASSLANANADQLRVQAGVGGVDLEFGGEWTRDLSVVARLAVGKLTLRVPQEVGMRIEVYRVAANFEHEGLQKRDDGAWYSANWDSAPRKLHVRAETFFGQVEVRRSTP